MSGESVTILTQDSFIRIRTFDFLRQLAKDQKVKSVFDIVVTKKEFDEFVKSIDMLKQEQ